MRSLNNVTVTYQMIRNAMAKIDADAQAMARETGCKVRGAKFVVRADGKRYAPKLVVAVALRLRAKDFSGGVAHLARLLAKAGFIMARLTAALIACSAGKLDHAAKAIELYTGQLFRLSAEWAARNADEVYILSALHGLIAADAEVAPYNVKLDPRDRPAMAAWGEKVRGAARVIKAQIVVLAGKDYRSAFEGEAEFADVVAPFAGLRGIGEMYSWCKNN